MDDSFFASAYTSGQWLVLAALVMFAIIVGIGAVTPAKRKLS